MRLAFLAVQQANVQTMKPRCDGHAQPRTRWQRGHLRLLAAGAAAAPVSSSSCCSTAASFAWTAAIAAAAFCPSVALREGATCRAVRFNLAICLGMHLPGCASRVGSDTPRLLSTRWLICSSAVCRKEH